MSDSIEFDTAVVSRAASVSGDSALAAPPALPATSPVGMMLAVLKEGATLEQVEKMMDLQERWETGEARKAFVTSLSAFKAETVEILKRREVDYTTKGGGRTQYKHAELSDVIEAVGPLLSRHGFSWAWTPKQDKDWITVTCTLTHVGGHSAEATLSGPPDTSGGKNSIQAVASTVTYLQRYTLKAVTGVSEKGDDTDGIATAIEDTSRRDTWVFKVNAATDNTSLQAIWQEGLQDLQANGTTADYNALKAVVLALKKGFDANTSQGQAK